MQSTYKKISDQLHKKNLDRYKNLLQIIRQNKILFAKEDLPSSINGLFDYKPGEDPLIIINKKLKGKKKIEVLAHELGHFFYGRSFPKEHRIQESIVDKLGKRILRNPLLFINNQFYGGFK